MEFKEQQGSTLVSDAIATLREHNVILGRARNVFYKKEAERKHFEKNLVLHAPGKSQSEKETYAMATQEWLDFHVELARLKSIFEHREFEHEILNKEWTTRYQEQKLDEGLIRKQE